MLLVLILVLTLGAADVEPTRESRAALSVTCTVVHGARIESATVFPFVTTTLVQGQPQPRLVVSTDGRFVTVHF